MKYINIIVSALVIGLLAACTKPDLPIAVTFRDATLEKSKVAQIHNNSKEVLKIRVTATGKDGASKISDEILLPPGGPLEIGWLEGWSFIQGEKIAISSPGFSNHKVSIP
jgi:hypothetical protein